MSPASSSIFNVDFRVFGRLVGSAAGHFRDFSFTGSARCRRANGRVVVNIWG
jgi:hypothetical protein